ncbi:MAG: heat-inducible transcription repressor HrcA [Elusimicrobia bacterium]|nr:heat-inducible transcription repressor HrcA [Elusimicrobiota bacterium]
MRQLKPEVVEERKKSLLQWVIHYYIKHSRPVSSSVIADEAGMNLSSATIRSILQELEEEGYLFHPHTSAGREPTDKGYRFYVDYLIDVQRLASDEKEKLERQYRNRIEEMDTLFSETSKLLSKISHGAGLVLSPKMRNHALKRLELIHLGGRNVLGILVTEAGMVRHWPIQVAFAPSARQINMLNRFLNDNIKGCSVQEAQAAVMAKLAQMETEFRELTALAGELLKEVGHVIVPEALYVEGADNILSQAEDLGDFHTLQSLLRVISEKEALAGLMEEELSHRLKEEKGLGKPLQSRVRIGQESGIPELGPFSLVTTTYEHKGRIMGVLGILGSKRMEYSRMMSLVEYMSDIVSRKIQSWDVESGDD